MSNTYRVTVMVTTDIESDSEADAMSSAIDKIRALVGDDPHSITGSKNRNCWVTGIASDSDHEYMAYKLEN
jgi:hypothetical protein